MRRPKQASITFLICALSAIAGGSEDAVPGIHVGSAVQVSANLSGDPHFETQLAADAGNSNNLIVCSILQANQSDVWETVTYVSNDGGKGWRLKLRVKADKQSAFDPTCAYGPESRAYTATEGSMRIDSATTRPALVVHASQDQGNSWSEINRLPHAERTYLSIDNTQGPLRGTILFLRSRQRLSV